jgi:hypothetical protein
VAVQVARRLTYVIEQKSSVTRRTPLDNLRLTFVMSAINNKKETGMEASTNTPTVVLVHGGFADSSYWVPVIEDLQAHDLPVLAPPNPLRGLAHDAEYTASFVNQKYQVRARFVARPDTFQDRPTII